MLIQHSKPCIVDEDRSYVDRVLSSSMVANGKLLKVFSERLLKLTNSLYLRVTSSGTSAIYYALKACGVGAGDEVILPTYTCPSVYQAILACNGKPVICDVGDHWNMTPDNVQLCITPATKAIILVNIFGVFEQPSRFRRFNIPIINDLCQSFDTALIPGLDIGDIYIFSFHATKCLNTGNGGALGTRVSEYKNNLVELSLQIKYLSPITDIQAALGLNQLDRYENFQERRRFISSIYFEELPAKFTQDLQSCISHWCMYRFPLKYNSINPDKVIPLAVESGLQVRRGVDCLLHRMDNLSDRKFKGAIYCYSHTISIPFYPALTDSEVVDVVNIMKNILNRI